jgi:hypothetical protein
MNCNYSQNEIKICENSQIVLFQSVELELILKTYNELLELIELFSENASDNKLTTLLTKKKFIEKKYNPIINEQKRLLKNTNNRLKYNINRALC